MVHDVLRRKERNRNDIWEMDKCCFDRRGKKTPPLGSTTVFYKKNTLLNAEMKQRQVGPLGVGLLLARAAQYVLLLAMCSPLSRIFGKTSLTNENSGMAA